MDESVLLHRYSEWLDGEGLIVGDETGDTRSHDDLVAAFLVTLEP